MKKKVVLFKWLNVIAFACMAAVNALANLLPIAGVKTEEIAQRYTNLFAPSDYAFAVWGVIYALLAGFALYQLTRGGQWLAQKCGVWFALSCVLNAVWMVLWHCDQIGLSVLCMAGLLVTLIVLNVRLADIKPIWQERLLVRAGFGLYYGWVTVATIANVTAWLVKIGWRGFGIDPELWTIVVLLLGVLIAALILIRTGNAACGAAVIWGYAGILVRHVAPGGFNLQYGWVIAATVLSLIILAFLTTRVFLKRGNGSLLE